MWLRKNGGENDEKTERAATKEQVEEEEEKVRRTSRLIAFFSSKGQERKHDSPKRVAKERPPIDLRKRSIPSRR